MFKLYNQFIFLSTVGLRILVEGFGRVLLRRMMGCPVVCLRSGDSQRVQAVGCLSWTWLVSAHLWCHDHLFKLVLHQKEHREVLLQVFSVRPGNVVAGRIGFLVLTQSKS